MKFFPSPSKHRLVFLFCLVILGIVVYIFQTFFYQTFISHLFCQTPQQILDGMSSFNEIVAALLAIIITVVAIIVELAATRYSSRIIDLFIEDKVNFSIIGFYIIVNLHGLWIYYLSARGYFLPVSAFINLIALSICLLIIIPYFSYIFRFLKPENVIIKITDTIIRQLKKLPEQRNTNRINQNRSGFVLGIEQISDIALNAVQSKDNTIGLRCLLSLKELLNSYFDIKSKLPASFFFITPIETIHPDYVALSEDKILRLSQDRIFLENKILKQYLIIFTHCLNENRDLNNMLAMCTRMIADKAIQNHDIPSLKLTIKYFNTFLRFTLNTQDIRTAYNVTFQYKKLAINLIHSQISSFVLDIVNYMKYYGLLFYQQKIGFILETIAHDIADVCIEAEIHNWNQKKTLLDIFLTVDQPADQNDEDRSLRGVRKAQIKLAAFYHIIGNIDAFQLIAQDMQDERGNRIESICQELLNTDEEFWEVIDRGGNFDYIPSDWRTGILKFIDYFRQNNHTTQGVTI